MPLAVLWSIPGAVTLRVTTIGNSVLTRSSVRAIRPCDAGCPERERPIQTKNKANITAATNRHSSTDSAQSNIDEIVGASIDESRKTIVQQQKMTNEQQQQHTHTHWVMFK